MGRFAAWVLTMVIACGATMQASGRHDKWKTVEHLGQGTEVLVEQQQGVPEDCRIVAVNDATLTCARDPDPDVEWGPGAKARVVFPRDKVRAIWIWAPVPEPHPGLWVAGVLGFIFGGAVCAEAGPAAIVGCGVLGALLAAGIAELAEQAGPDPRYPRVGWPMPPPPPSYPARPRELQRKLVYQAPAAEGVVAH